MPPQPLDAGKGDFLHSHLTPAVLRQLVELRAQGSLGAVARHLGLSQPTVSANLARLEQAVGIPLMLRGTSGTRLTREGDIVADASQAVLEAAQGLARTIEDLSRVGGSPLRIAASLTIAEQLVPRWLADRRISSLVEPGQAMLSVGNSHEVMDWVAHDQADLGFVEGNRIWPNLAHTPVGQDELVVVVGPSHRWFRAQRAILSHELIRGGLVLRERGSGTLEVLEDALERRGVSLPAHIPRFGSTSAILTAVRHGAAAAVVSRLAVESDLEQGRLSAVEVTGLTLKRTLSAVWSESTAPRADAAALISNVAKIWGQTRPWPVGA